MVKMRTGHKLYKNPGSAGGMISYISFGESLGQQGTDFYYEVIDIVHLALIDISTSYTLFSDLAILRTSQERTYPS